MKIQTKDQISISSVQADSLRPGQVFEVSDAAGEELLRQHPHILKRVDDDPAPAKSDASQKADPPPRNKSDTRRKTKSA